MNMFKCLSVAMVLAMSVVQPAFAKGDDKKEFVIVNEAVGVPDDITDRPYEVVGDVKAGVRKATIFSKEASQEKIYKELWERAETLDADAVINAKYGDSHVTAFSWGKTNATGTAIRFVEAPAPVAPAPAAAASAEIGAAASSAEPAVSAGPPTVVETTVIDDSSVDDQF